jgi:hypothetical protein
MNDPRKKEKISKNFPEDTYGGKLVLNPKTVFFEYAKDVDYKFI